MAAPQVPPGLCDTCLSRQAVGSRSGAVFVLCRRSREDARYPRYPVLPVVRCVGYEPGSAPAGAAVEGS